MRTLLLRVVTIVATLLLAPSIASAEQSSAADGLIDRFVQAWNSHDKQHC